MKSKKYASVNQNRCVACGACSKECPRNAIQIFKGCFAQVDSDLCVGCGRCANVCPAGCITVNNRDSVENN